MRRLQIPLMVSLLCASSLALASPHQDFPPSGKPLEARDAVADVDSAPAVQIVRATAGSEEPVSDAAAALAVECPHPPAQAAPFFSGVNGILEPGDCKGSRLNRHADFYTFPAVAGREYTCHGGSNGWLAPIDVLLIVRDPDGKVVAESSLDQLGNSVDAVFVAAVSGEYLVEVTSLEPTTGSGYYLFIYQFAFVLVEDAESGAPGWTVSTPSGLPWAVVQSSGFLPNRYFRTNAGFATYEPNTIARLQSPSFSLVDRGWPGVAFKARYKTAGSADALRVYASSNGGFTWTLIQSFSGTSAGWPGWADEYLSLSMLPRTATCRLRFVLTSDGVDQDLGASVDDIVVRGQVY